jgi:polysaccharide biosynthesis transport protein
MDRDKEERHLTRVKHDVTEYSADFPRHHPIPYVTRTDNELVEDSGSLDVRKYLELFLKYWKLIMVCVVLGVVLAALWTVRQTPEYRGRTSVEVVGSSDHLTGSSSDRTSSTEVQTQAKVLESWTIRRRVLRKLQPSGEESSTGPVDEPAIVSSPKPEKPVAPRPPAKVSIWPAVKALFFPRDPVSPLEMAAQTLKVTPVKTSNIIEITCESTDNGLAAQFVNSLVSEYLEQRMEDRWEAYNTTGQWLTRAQEDLKAKLEASEQGLQEYARSSGLMFTGENQNVAEEKLKQLQQELSGAEADRIQKEAKYKLTNSSSPESLPEVLDSGPLTQYQLRLAELRRQLAELTSSLTPAHPKVLRVQAQISELESTLTSERRNVVRRLKNEYQSAQERERMLAGKYASQTQVVSGQAEKTIQYNLLKKDVETNRQLYQTALQRGKEASIDSALRSSNLRVVDRARPSLFPSSPMVLLNLALGLVGGCFVGIGLVLLREHLNQSVRMPGETSAYLNVPELGVIPSSKVDVKLDAGSLSKRFQNLIAASVGSAKGPNGRSQSVELVTWNQKPSILAESFRAALTSILFSNQEGIGPGIIAVTSSMPSEGKTTVICNLGIALAEINRRVVIVDADMRKPQLHRILAVANTWGLSDMLREHTPIDDYPKETLVRKTGIPNLNLLVSGPGAVSVASLLHSDRMPHLLERLRTEFDVVLIDSPPMLQLADARVVGRLSDGVILVIRAGKTSQDSAAAAVHRFTEDGTRVLGTILNDWNPKNAAPGQSYKYGHMYYYSSK